MSNIKQVIIVCTRYPDGKGGFFKPRTGKLIAQGAHASMKVFFDRSDTGFTWQVYLGHEFRGEDDPTEIGSGDPAMLTWLTTDMVSWVEGLFTKVCLKATSEEQLVDLAEKASKAGLPHALIQDNGTSEFHNQPTYTALAIGPAKAEDIDPITGDLKLL